MSDHPQLAFGHFRVASHADGTAVELGRGAMGVTYKAFDERLRIDVALKLITPAQMDNPKAQSSFLREARAAARVHQTNVASVVFLNDTPGNFFYAMEFVEGQPLRDWMRAHPAQPPPTVIGIALQIARGLEAIHEQQLVHRDLKPTNVMMVKSPRTSGGPWQASDPEAWTVKIIDFGLARAISAAPGAATQTAGFHGTALYASPEQCEERTDIDGRSDQYSLGCMMWELLCGAPPFHARTHRELLNQHVSEPLPMDRLSHVPPSLSAVVARLLIKDPENRFPSATALIKALERCRDKIESGEEAVEEHAPTTIDPLAFAHSDAGRPGSTPGSSPPSTTSSSRRDLWIVGAAVLALIIPGLIIFSWRSSPGTAKSAVQLPAPRSPVQTGSAAASQKSVALLPFTNLSSDKENEFIADGVLEDVIANLRKISALRTISRTSTQRYRAKGDISLRDIARELGADSIVEGSIQGSGDRIVLYARLIDPETEQTIWDGKFERKVGDKFGLQSDIAIAIADALKAKLEPAERSEVNRLLSDNPAALEAYFRGRGLMKDLSDSRNIAAAATAFQKAVAIDPKFAQAYAQLAILLSTAYDWGDDRTPERQALAAKSAEAALELQPDLPEAQLAMGIYAYRVLRDFPKAQPYLERAIATMPGNVGALFEMAVMERRQGRWDDAVDKFERVAALAPDDAYKQYTIARTYLFMRRYEDAWRILQAAQRRQPENDFLNVLKGELMLAWKGDFGFMRDNLATRPATVPDPENYVLDKVSLKLLERRFDEALAVLRESSVKVIQGQTSYITRDALEAEILTQAGRIDEARPIWRRVSAELANTVKERPADPRVRMAYALALAGSGDAPEAAVRTARQVADERSVEKDAMDGTDFQLGLALVLLRNGDLAGATEVVKRIRSIPSIVYDSEFKFSATWDPIRPMLGLDKSK